MKYLYLLFGLILSSCAVLEEPKIVKNVAINNYQYVVLPTTNSLSSSVGGAYGNQYGLYGGTTSKEVNPRSVIEGILLKRGLVSVDEVTPEIIDKTLLVKYGESGRRDVVGGLGGYTLETTIAFISAKTNEIVYSCSAEGQGATEADDIRQAITRCLSGL